MSQASASVQIGMVGGGTVGGGVYQAIDRNALLIASRTGVLLKIKRIAVKALDEPRSVEIPVSLLTTDWKEVVNDPEVQVVVELVGGTGVAREVILAALEQGKSVVTANKALLASHGEELFKVAQENDAALFYEASVAGGIPLIRSIREGLVCNRFLNISGIVNGTCNYILTQMEALGHGFEEVLKEAQTNGYAEANPALDVEGHDAHHKISILASLAYNAWVAPEKVYREGISSITGLDIQTCKEWGYKLKLLGTVKHISREADVDHIQVRVAPTLIPQTHILASVDGVFNGVSVRGDVVDETFFYGRGAGQDATASAVIGDITDAALDISKGIPARLIPMSLTQRVAVLPFDELRGRFYIRIFSEQPLQEKVEKIIQGEEIQISSTKAASDGSASFTAVLTEPTDWKRIEKVLAQLKMCLKCTSEPVAYVIEDFSK
ncbi:MAG: homoserine dehydrogenase [Limisphaerales bacterium]|jgi:homoserine dehydrogenase